MFFCADFFVLSKYFQYFWSDISNFKNMTPTGSITPAFTRSDWHKYRNFNPTLDKKEVIETIPEDSMSSEEFWTEAHKILDKLCDKYGIV